MAGGVIHVRAASGDVIFLSAAGKEILEPSKGVKVSLDEDFAGETLEDALQEAKKYAIGGIKQKVQQKTRGVLVKPVVRNLDVKYTVKYGFS